jgi:flagellin-like protein
MRKAKVVWHRDDDAVSPVIGTILMVAITVVLAAVLWLMVSGMITGPDEEKVTVNIATPDVQAQTRTNPCWDATLNINKITPKDEKVKWTEVRCVIKSASGSILNTALAPTADTPASYNDPAGTGPGVVQFWFVETDAGDTKMSAGDAIKVTGMDVGYEGATVDLTKAGERIGSITLPTNFP